MADMKVIVLLHLISGPERMRKKPTQIHSMLEQTFFKLTIFFSGCQFFSLREWCRMKFLLGVNT